MNRTLNNECIICLAAIDPELPRDSASSLYATSCGHRFHLMCIFRWCSLNNSCPTCRSPQIFSFSRNIHSRVNQNGNNPNYDNDNLLY